MANKNIPDPGFSDDDGSADPRLSAALAAWAEDRGREPEVLAALKDARLLVPVVAVLGEVETDPETGLKREKTSDMAVPTLQAGDRRALPAFTSIASLALWDPAARPVAVPLHQALKAAAHEKADTVVLDLAGPVTYQLTGSALLALAEGRTDAGPLADPAVREAVRAAVSAEPAVLRAHLGPAGADADGTLAIVLAADPQTAPAAARRVAEALAADETLRARLVRGLNLALLPADAPAPPGEPLFSRG
ncbi:MULTISPECIES: SseB family protein [unclassified Streptomyces]|uniref:SseB family protein n=1 Tax=unclassified Streptomyces TaxID=2593676 RepID=UPI001BE58C37|nr:MULTISPECIES: SseB family protein [unclassified Streptomyces]MBT2403705.1 SseB family protein [Streptomyces sp. ISL-21]MBT2611238.1 SseB family protein [Streptomyces sp. ISL-87]